MNKRIAAVVVALFVGVIAHGQGLYWESGTSGGALGDRVISAQNYYMPHMFKSATKDMGGTVIDVSEFRLECEPAGQVRPIKQLGLAFRMTGSHNAACWNMMG